MTETNDMNKTKETKMEIHSLNNSIYSTKHFSQVVPAHLNRIKARLDAANKQLAEIAWNRA